MSTVRATHRTVDGATAPQRREPTTRETPRPALRVVPRPRGRGVGVVVFLATTALFASLFGLAVFHTMLVQSQSDLDELDAEITEAEATTEQLRLRIAQNESPERILDRAEDIGMTPAEDTVVLDATAGEGDAGGEAPEGSAPDSATADDGPPSDSAADPAG
jgi:cell division protein FtsL